MMRITSQKAENKSQSIVGSLFRKSEDSSAYKNMAPSKLTNTTAFNFGNINFHRSGNNSLVQPKLEINQPGDQYEQEADAMADKVMRVSDKDVAQNSYTSGMNIQRKCAECEKEDKEKKLQRKENSSEKVNTGNHLETYVKNLGNSGQPLSREERNFFEPKFGHDFSKVRIHNDHRAADSAKAINAQAYTYGNNIVFNQSKYSPQTNAGKKLMAHELSHTIQQTNGRKASAFGIQRSPGSPAGGCGACYGTPNLVGLAAHKVIQAGIKKLLGKHAVIAERLVPSPGDENSRLDIAISSSLETVLIAEIKPNNQKGKEDGIRDIKYYTRQLNALGAEVVPIVYLPRIPVMVFPTLGSGPNCPKTQRLNISLNPSAEGVILYDCEPDFKDVRSKCDCRPWKKKNKKEKEDKEKDKEKGKEKESEKEQKKSEPEKEQKKSEKEKGEKKSEKEKGSKGGAANFGFGISIGGSSVGAGNAGIGISIMSDGASVGTLSAGIVYNSQGVAIGSVSGGISSGSTGAAAGTAVLGTSEDDMGASAGQAAMGRSKGNIAANAGVAGTGETEGQTTAQAGKAGKADPKQAESGEGNEATNKAIAEAGKIEEALKNATPQQRKLLEKMAQKQGGNYQVPDPEWMSDFIQSTKNITDADVDKLANSSSGNAQTDLKAIKQASQGGSGGTEDKKGGEGKGSAGSEQKGKGEGNAGATDPKFKHLNDDNKKKIDGASAPVKTLFKSFASGQKEDALLTDELVGKFFEIVPTDLTQEEADKLIDGMTSSKGKSPDEIIKEMKQAIEEIRKGKKSASEQGGQADATTPKDQKEEKAESADYGKVMAEKIKKKDWKKIKGFEVVRTGDKTIRESKLGEEITATLYQRYHNADKGGGDFVTAVAIKARVTSLKPLTIEVISSNRVVGIPESSLHSKKDSDQYTVSEIRIPAGKKFSHGAK
jgi:hypothetical protein